MSSMIKRLLAYIIMPVIFCFIGYILLWTALKPVWDAGVSVTSFMISDDMPSFNASLTSTYKGSSKKENVSEAPADENADAGTQVTATDSSSAGTTAPAGENAAAGAETPAADNTSTGTTAPAGENASAGTEGTVTAAVQTMDQAEFEEHLKAEFVEEYPEAATAAGITANASAPVTQTADETAYPFIPITEIEYPEAGDHYAQLDCERIGLDAPVYWYDTNEILMAGVGQSLASKPPGFGRLVLLAGHNNSYFKCLQDAVVGDVVHLDTNYDNYTYVVTSVEVMNENKFMDTLGDKFLAEKEELVMYTCYPFHVTAGRKTDRYVVTAQRISGINIKWRNLE